MTERTRMSRVLADQRSRFVLVGAVNTAVGYGIFAVSNQWLFKVLRYGYLASMFTSYSVAIVLAFVLYRRYVFHVTGQVIRDFLFFVTVYLTSIAVNAVLLPTLVEGARMRPLVAQAVVLLVTTLISFFGHKEISFRR